MVLNSYLLHLAKESITVEYTDTKFTRLDAAFTDIGRQISFYTELTESWKTAVVDLTPFRDVQPDAIRNWLFYLFTDGSVDSGFGGSGF